MDVEGKKYTVQRIEPYYYGGDAVYLWGLCAQKGGEEAWES